MVFPITNHERNTMTTRHEPDACTLLDQDHREVKKMFKAYDDLVGSKAKSTLAKKQALAARSARR